MLSAHCFPNGEKRNHLAALTDPSLQVLRAGVKELFKDTRIFVMHSDALEQIQDGVNLLVDYGEKALEGLK